MALPHNKPDHEPGDRDTRPRINIPPPRRATPEEIARRRALYDEVMALREAIGPIGISADELIHQARCEEDDYDY